MGLLPFVRALPFANEIGAICQQAGIDAYVVMTVFHKNTSLNIAPGLYLMPGLAFGGSCLPKGVRARSYKAKQCDIDRPLTAAILPRNQKMVDRAFENIRTTNVRHIALIGLSFKPRTADLCESSFVELAARLRGKEYRLRIYDPNLSVALLTSTNKDYIDSAIPHLVRLLVPSLEDLNDAELLVIAPHFSGIDALLQRTDTAFIDLQGRVAGRTEREPPRSASQLPLRQSPAMQQMAKGSGFAD